MSRFVMFGLLSTVAVSAAFSGCRRSVEEPGHRRSLPRPTRTTEPNHPDVLLVSIDTLRADHCSVYGYERNTTPELQGIADEGVRFDAAYAPTGTTAPSHVTLLTGLYPYSHGVLKNGHKLTESAVTAAEIFKDLGYQTVAFVSTVILREKVGINQGFDHYDVGPTNERTADLTVAAGADWLNEHATATRDPIFMWLHLRDPHEPYAAPESFGDPFGADEAGSDYDGMVACYDTEIAFTDLHLGRLVDRFQEVSGEDGAVIVITADHGESFLEHGWRGHGAQIYDEIIRVPLIVRWKGHLAGPRTVDIPVGLLDVLPTLLSLIGRPPADTDFQGVDLSGLFRGSRAASDERPLFFQRCAFDNPGLLRPKKVRLGSDKSVLLGEGIYIHGDKYAIRSGQWKYLEALKEEKSRELYDLDADPAEQSNLASERPDVVGRCSREIAVWRGETTRNSVAAGVERLSPQDFKELRALGYLEPDKEEQDEPAPPHEPARRKRR